MQMIERGRQGAYTRQVRRAAMLTMAVCLTLAAGCNTGSDPDTVPEPTPVTRLRVENQAFLDMTIYVYRSSQRIRLGQATGNSTSRFVIPSNLVFGATTLRFQADPIGGTRTPISQEIVVSPGDEIILTIPPS